MISYYQFLARYPYVITVATIIVVAICGGVGFTKSKMPDFGDPTKGFETRGTELSRRTKSLTNALELNVYDPRGDFFDDNNVITGRRRRSQILLGPNNTIVGPGPSGQMDECANVDIDESWPHVLVFESSTGESMFTVKALRAVCSINDEFVDLRSRYCPGHSVGFYIGVLNNKTCDEITDDDVMAFKYLLEKCAPYYYRDELGKYCDPFVDDCTGIPQSCQSYHGVYKVLNFLTDSGFMAKDTNSTVLKYAGFFISDTWAVDWLDFYTNHFGDNYDNGVIKFSGGDLHIKYELFEKFMLQDMYLFVISIGLVLCLMVVYFRSLLVTAATFFSICFSAVIAYFIYNIVFQMEFFPFLNISAIVVLIGVGADDVFVLFDIFMQMKKEHPDYELDARLRKTFQHAIFSILVTSLTTSTAFYATLVSSITSIKCFGVFAGTCILVNFFLMVTWVPSIMVLSHKFSTCINQKCKYKCCSCTTRVKDALTRIADFPRKLFTQWMPVLVVKLRFLWLILFGLLGVGGLVAIFAVPGLKPPTSDVFVLLREYHPFERYDQVIRNQFRFEEAAYPLNIYFVWGVKDIDNGNHLNPDDSGHITLHPNSNFFADDYLRWMVEFCADLIQSSIYGDLKTKTCFSTYQKILMDSCHLIENMNCCDGDLYNDNSSYITTCFKELPGYIVGSALSNFNPLGSLLVDKESRVKAYVMSMTSTRDYTNSYVLMDSFYQNVSTFFQEQINSAPEFVRSGWFAAPAFEFYDLQRSLFSSFVLASGISLLLAAVLMVLTSRNVLITIYAIISILFALAVTVGSLVLAGWTLNILESVVFTLAVGLSIDFPIHYGVAYRQSHFETRVERVNEVFVRVGFPVALAALSTILAGVAMLGTQIMVYYQLGLFLVVVMIISWAYGTFFFLSLCACFGPLKKFCLIPMPGKKESHKLNQVNNSVNNSPSHFTNFDLDHMANGTTKNKTENSGKKHDISNDHIYIVESSDADNRGIDNPGISRILVSVPGKQSMAPDEGLM